MGQTTDIVVAAAMCHSARGWKSPTLKLTRWSHESVPEGAYTDLSSVSDKLCEERSGRRPADRSAQSDFSREDSWRDAADHSPGMRAMSLPVDEVADISGFVKPHTRVDVVVTLSTNESHPFSKIVLQNVEVLAVEQQIERGKDEAVVAKVVTLLVSPHDAKNSDSRAAKGPCGWRCATIATTRSSRLPEATSPIFSAAHLHSAWLRRRARKRFRSRAYRAGRDMESRSCAMAGGRNGFLHKRTPPSARKEDFIGAEKFSATGLQ